MKRLTVLILLNTILFSLSAQIDKYGTPVSKSYSMKVTQAAEQNWAITKDKFGVLWLGGEDNFVNRYDGSKWTKILLDQNNPTIVRALAADENGIIYVGGNNQFGYIEPDSSGSRIYKSLKNRFTSARDITDEFLSDTSTIKLPASSEITIGELKSLIIKDSVVYFLSDRTLIMYDKEEDSISYVNLRALGFRQFERIYLLNGRIILANNRLGLLELKDNKIKLLPGGDFFKFKRCMAVFTYKSEKIVVTTLDRGIFLFDCSTGEVDSSLLEKKIFKKLKEEFWTYSAVRLPTGEMIFGTTDDGAYVFNESGKFIGHWTSENLEMQDNVITTMYTDPSVCSELWISTTGSVTKAYVNLPFTQFCEKMGLLGSVSTFCEFNDDVYVAADQGLFKSIADEDGHRVFTLVNDINSQIFPLIVAKVDPDSFLLAGSTFGDVYQVNSNGKSFILPFIQDNTKTIYQSRFIKSRFYIGLGNGKIYILDYKKGKWHKYASIVNISGVTDRYVELDNGDILVLTSFPASVCRIPVNDSIPLKYSAEQGLPEIGLNYLCEDKGKIILSTDIGLYQFNITNDRWEPCDYLTGNYSKNLKVDALFRRQNGELWISTNEDRYYDIFFRNVNDSLIKTKGGALDVLPNLKFRFLSEIEGKVWIAKSNSIYIIDDSKLNNQLPAVQTLLTKIIISAHGADSLVMNETFFRKGAYTKRYPVISNAGQKAPEFKYNLNSPSFYWTTPYMIQEEDILYSYKLQGFEDDWSKWDKISYKDFTNLSFGKYTFRVKAKTITGIESHEATYSFVILKPWYVTPWMIFLYFIAATLSVILIIMAYTKRLKNENIRLEGIVKERTAVVVKQKEELESSIHYASRIQMALLPSEAILSENIKNYFVLFKPRDIVSGDFYWMTKKNNRLYIVAADCTGHGVPGAFMSLLGMSFLDEIIDKEAAPRSDYILNQLRLHVTDSLKQMGGDDEAKDGIDMALLVIDFNTQRIEFSGAYNPCFKVRKLSDQEIFKYENEPPENPDGSMSNGKYLLETIYASKMPIGISSRMNESFAFYDWELKRGISYYMFSDGYIDQFGGDHGRKFMKKKFKRLLLEIQDYPMSKQKELLDKNLRDWMGETPQIDDILVMGIRTD
jgi:serine phosphatase RsbU (regulator of sigma subunit)